MDPLIILTSDPGLPSVGALLRSACELGITASTVNPLKSRILQSRGKGQQLLIKLYQENEICGWEEVRPPALVIPRIGSLSDDYSLSIAHAMETAGFRLVNRYKSLLRLRTKVDTLLELYRAQIPTIPYFILRTPSNLTEEIREIGGNPVLVKFIRGSQGLGVMKTSDTSSASALVNAFNRLGYDVYVEKYIADRRKKDLRFLVVKGKVLAAMEKKPLRGEYRANIHLGAKALPYKPSQGEIELAEKAARYFELDICGVDILKTKDGPFVLEVNSSPGLIGISEATGRNIAKELLMAFYPARK